MRGGLRVGVIGLGFMGRTHVGAYRSAGAELAAVCDGSADRLSGSAGGGGNLGSAEGGELFDRSSVRAVSDIGAFLETPGLRAVSVCTPTDTHAAIAERVIDAGKHVLIEKPVSLDASAVRALAERARGSGASGASGASGGGGVVAMAAMCMRFWPAWAWVRRAIEDGRYGPVRAARFERLGAKPAWGGGFYGDPARSGGALFDLHIHDADFVVHAFGPPSEVLAVGDEDHVSVVYTFAGGPGQVVAHGGWLRGVDRPFEMRMLVEFEGAVADFELGREPGAGGELRVYPASGGVERPEVSDEDGWTAEVRAFVGAVERAESGGAVLSPASLDSAAVSTAVVEAERESLRSGGPVAFGDVL